MFLRIDLGSYHKHTLILLTFILKLRFLLCFSMEEKTAIGQCWCHEGGRVQNLQTDLTSE